ncbi:MAG TPA: hypothetical protein VHT96_06810, partial [Clostridia bacterium]|nr:hypothetical protein [Clostridia bacterium]
GSLPVVDNPEEYILKSSNRYLSLKKQDITNYDALAEESSTDTQLIELDDKSLNTLRTCKLYTGIIQTESGVDLIGFRILTKVEGKSAVCLTYAGTGNYSDILVEAFEIMRGI